ncbi:hypothetical protein JMUB4039_1489 [Leptotrichia trevisanii]|uniref:hypothetical protein n=1 Tax=Leptotrichia trevisanii TaxID=109328 RepID=UPI001187CDB4|nr:hypothetical protein [Leptotrichia trevisanii]BBM57510.1 hypothetical protein JMUB4039_1489 [Leptotrichia trevisanii]
MKKNIIAVLIAMLFMVSCGSKAKVDSSKCIKNTEDIQKNLKEFLESSNSGSLFDKKKNRDVEKEYNEFIKAYSTLGCALNSENINQRFTEFENYNHQKNGENELMDNEKATGLLYTLRVYKIMIANNRFNAAEEASEKVKTELENMEEEIKKVSPDKVGTETVKAYNEITPLLNKEIIEKSPKELINLYYMYSLVLKGIYDM